MRLDELPPPPQPSSMEQPRPQLPQPVVLLEYSPRDAGPTPGSRVVNFLRRLALAAGIALMSGAMLIGMFPRADEEVIAFCFGLGLVLLAIPLPKLPGW